MRSEVLDVGELRGVGVDDVDRMAGAEEVPEEAAADAPSATCDEDFEGVGSGHCLLPSRAVVEV